jgi:hypothetical protein
VFKKGKEGEATSDVTFEAGKGKISFCLRIDEL